MGDYKFYLKQPPASELVDKFLKIVEEASPSQSINYFVVFTNTGQLNLLGPAGASRVPDVRQRGHFSNILTFLTERPWLDVTGVSLNTTAEYNLAVRTDKGFYILLSTSGSRDSNADAIAPIGDALQRHFNILRHQDVLEAAIPEAERSSLQTAQSILLDFSTQAARLAQLSAANTERMNDIILKKTAELDNLYQQKQKELEATHSTRSAELTQKEEAFRQEKARMDARENTVVRRDLLAKIETILGDQKQITITTSTLRKRVPIHVICGVAILLALTLIGGFGYRVLNDTAADLHHIAPLTTGFLLFVSTAIFYIRWADLWFKEHANAEFENRKFYVDVVRASWIAELLFEWKDKKEVPFPEKLIASYTTGLFEASDIVKTARHPFDDLKSLAGSVSEIKFSKKGGISLKKNSPPDE